MSRTAVLTDKSGEQVMPITKGECVYYDENTTINEKVDSMESGNNSVIQSIENEISVERARISNLAQLDDGSTTGDAELIDGRIDYFGYEHANIGDAIRSIIPTILTNIVTVPLLSKNFVSAGVTNQYSWFGAPLKTNIEYSITVPAGGKYAVYKSGIPTAVYTFDNLNGSSPIVDTFTLNDGEDFSMVLTVAVEQIKDGVIERSKLEYSL